MQKSKKFICDFMPRIIVPLDSAVFLLLYARYYTALRDFLQYFFTETNKTQKRTNFQSVHHMIDHAIIIYINRVGGLSWL